MDWLEDITHHSSEYWMSRVQQLIDRYSTPPATESKFESGDEQTVQVKGHGNTQTEVWVAALYAEIRQCAFEPINPEFGYPPYDGNMRIAAVMGTILCLWYGSTQQAKLLDSRRPLEVRLTAWPKFTKWRSCLQGYLFDQSKLSTYFPDQPWQFLWDPGAVGGNFL